MPAKVCTQCGVEKSWNEFHRSANGRPRSRCKPCLIAYNKEHRNPENHAPREPGWVRARRLDPTQQRRDSLARYKITAEQYDAMLDRQGGVCAICEQPETVGGKTLAVDHCHTRGHIRGLLCNRCNLLLGKAHDNPNVLEAAASYLRRRF